MIIAKDAVVSIHYILRDSDGNELENTYDGRPFEFVFGKGMVIPGLEKSIEGLKAGDEKDFVVPPQEGYGLRDKNLVIKLHRKELPDDDIIIGREFRKVFSNGETEIYKITGFVEDWVYLDKNHPLAGIDLHFEVRIIDVRPAIAS
ncbi:MAG: peptidylprolyl isomerase [Spirochaetota bacterium]|nr:peptidylprolyl isomerase [Spirochaetota bacterium]